MIGKVTCYRLKTQGFGLVELMVALVLGLVLMGAAISVYLNNMQSARFQNGVMRVQENGRFAIDLLSRTFRMAGYDDPDAGGSVGNVFISGSNSASGATFTEDGMKTDGETVSITYEGGTSIRDCQGDDVTVGTVVTNQYAIWIDNDGISHLICNTANGNGQPLAEGVENMQILYGLDLNSDKVANRWVSAADVGNWGQVAGIHLSLLVNSVVPASGQNDTVCLGCTDFNGSADLLIRGEFQTTIQIRN